MKLFLVLPFIAALALAQPTPEPRLTSVFPFTVSRGQTVSVLLRGVQLDGAHTLYFPQAKIQARLEDAQPAPDPIPAGSKAPPPQQLRAHLTVPATLAPGAYKFRVTTARGLSNELTLRVADQAVLTEPTAPVAIPSVVTGIVAESGEVDQYWIEARAGQSISLRVTSGSDTLDPAVGIYEPSGSWFDANRQNRLAFNDEPLNFPGLSRDAALEYTFARAGRYGIRIEGFGGQGGPDAVYELRIAEGQHPLPDLRPNLRSAWTERELTRSFGDDWMKRLAERGDNAAVEAPETYRAVPEGSKEIPVMKLPGMVEGVITQPGQTHVIRINVEKPQETVIEVETPEATTPIFTPVVRLLEPGGQEIVGNLYTRLNNNNFKMMKAVMAKTTFSLLAPGIHTLEIHELTTDHAGPAFRYRVLVRPQIPHLGRFIIQQEKISLERGATRPVSVRIEREEGYKGLVAVQLENLPPGVTSQLGLENPNDRPVLPNAGKTERYQPRVQPASLVVTAAPDAPLSDAPATVRVVARPVRDDGLGDPIATADLLLLVVDPRKTEKK